jgi:hypothetical protein
MREHLSDPFRSVARATLSSRSPIEQRAYAWRRLPQCIGAAARMMLNGTRAQSVVLEPRTTGEPSHVLRSAWGPQAWQSRRSGGIPSSVDDPTASWQGREDRSVALLVYLPPFSLGSGHQPARIKITGRAAWDKSHARATSRRRAHAACRCRRRS